MSNFSFKPSGYSKEEGSQPKDQGFIRSKKDNLLLRQLQLQGNFFDTVDPDATLWADFDGVPFKCASSVEENYITVKLITPEEDVVGGFSFTGEKEFKNRTEFKGRTRGDKIGTGSFLSDLNLSREVNGLTPFTMQDFEITDGKRLKFEKGTTIDGKKFENSLEVCKYYMDEWVNACLVQTQLKKVKPVMGSGKTHRHDVLVPHQYKSDRSDNRPILLSEARKYLEDNYDTFIAPPLMEADEVVDAMAARAYDHAKATNTKVRVVKAANDKDARSKRGILFDWAKSFHFNNPQCWEIKDFSEDVGALEMKKGEVKGGGAVFFAYQLLMIDSADEYSPRKYLPEDFEHFGKGYGDESFYKDFAPLKTSKEVFQKVVDKYFEWFPKGLKYTAWDGTDIEEDTLSYLQKHYQLAYMLEGKDDKSTVVDLLDKFEVNYSSITNNHIEKVLPIATEDSIRETYEGVSSVLGSLQKIIGDTKGKKEDLIARMVDVDKQLGYMQESLTNGLFGEPETPVITNNKRRSIEQIVSDYNKENGYEPSPREDHEYLIECLCSFIESETTSEHRWYDIRENLYSATIDGEERFFKCFSHHITGDNSASDMGLDLPTIDDVYEVFPKQVMTTVYE